MDPITQYSRTHRIVLLIDLDPLLHNHNHNHYTTTVLSSAKTLLSFPPLSSSLFAFKLFFSSLSPLLSSSKLHPFLPKPSLSLSFDHSSSTLHLLSHTLSSLPQFPTPPPSHHPKASHLAASMRQLLHDYAWDPDPVPADTYNSVVVPHNLVLLFSPMFESFQGLSAFLDVNAGDESLRNVISFCERLSGFFGSVSRLFDSRGIHFSWVSVSDSFGFENDEVRNIRGLFETGAGKLGWGFCSVDSIVLGSVLVPFGLIYPKIGISWESVRVNHCSSRKVQVQLSLQILDVNGNPIELNCCDLELVDLKILGRCEDVRLNPELTNLQAGGCERKENLWKLCLDGITKLELKVVRKSDAFVNLRDCFSHSVLVREVFRESTKKHKGSSNESFADRVLEIVATDFGCQWQRKSVPIWEILLSFLYKEGCWALVSVTNGNGRSCMGILRPFTVSSALLSILGDPQMACDSGGANMVQYVKTVDAEICKSERKVKKNKDLLDSQAKKSAIGIEGHQKKKMMDLNTLQNLTWSSFCNLVHDQFEIDLHDVYYVMECNKSKKLKFLKCWMKQMKQSACCNPTLSEKPKPNQIIAEEVKDKLTELPQNGEQPISSPASAGINADASTLQDNDVLDFRSETSEAFFSNLSNKIHQGIASEVIHLGALSERLVNSSIYWLRQKVDRENISECHSPLKGDNACGSVLATELIKLLLREPKELAAKHKSRNSFSQASDPGPTTLITEHVVREYELQILFRMQILQSEVGSGVEDSSKQKFVKQICLLLENIQCHMEGGFFGDWNLENYVAKIIKNRYSHTLEDVVHKIYNKMDLLLFADEDEAPNSLLNSEDSNKSLNKKVQRDETGENDVSHEPVSAENEPFQLQTNDSGRFQRIIEEDHDQKLVEAKERRERARRFSSFTSWMPDLQRVWAPKQNGMKSKTDPFRKLPKRKERQRANDDTVCETPMTMTGNKRSSRWSDGSQKSGSVSKALFQDDH
ncbi:uncharacterized protein LOC133288321 [Gastrolobium bilobum]|uniref:uncharacterized protein LOC133288321 n=1 Tax=Gastrolobium bilobum TaxID=150636 RepID=UPI002AB1C49D|nr:uncharacterized protein LOC133288321 [Gastrolobium bilobum]